jgi:hypothetical protein
VLAEGSLQPLLSLAKRENGDLESQRYAIFALTNLAASRINHAQLLPTGMLAVMANLMEDDDMEIRNSAILAMGNFASNPENHEGLAEIDCVQTLVELTATHNPLTQLRAVATLRGLSTNEALRAEIVRRGGLQPLLWLTQSQDVEIQMEVLACLCNLSLSGCIGDNPIKFLEACDIRTLVSYLCSADSTYRLFGALALGNIASKLDLQKPMVDGGAMSPLISVAQYVDLETQRCIAYALCNLGADPKRRKNIVNEGGLPPIISMACSTDAKDALAGIATLRGFAADPESRRHILTSGALEALTLGVKNEDNVEVAQEVACAFCSLSLNEENKVDMVSPAHVHVIKDLVSLATRPDAKTARHAFSALANLAENHKTHTALLGHWVMEACVQAIQVGPLAV